MRIQFNVTSLKQTSNLFATLHALGYTFYPESEANYKTNPQKVAEYFFRGWPAIYVNTENKKIDAYGEVQKYMPVASTFEDFVAALLNPEITVKLNDEYTAIVTPTAVKVGCQTFGFDVVDALKEAVDKQRR